VDIGTSILSTFSTDFVFLQNVIYIYNWLTISYSVFMCYVARVSRNNTAEDVTHCAV